jgi:LPXTG-motif cell wall-anchored protein
MDAASNTINTMIKENTKLTIELAFNSAVSGALGSSSVDSASTGDNTNLYIGMAVVAILMVGGYYFYSKKTTPAVAGAPAPAAAPAATYATNSPSPAAARRAGRQGHPLP